MRQSFPLFSLVNIFFIWKSSLCMKKTGNKAPSFGLYFYPCQWNTGIWQRARLPWWHFYFSNPAIWPLKWEFMLIFFLPFFLTSEFMIVKGWLTFPCQNRTPVQQRREKESWGLQTCRCSSDGAVRQRLSKFTRCTGVSGKLCLAILLCMEC